MGHATVCVHLLAVDINHELQSMHLDSGLIYTRRKHKSECVNRRKSLHEVGKCVLE